MKSLKRVGQVYVSDRFNGDADLQVQKRMDLMTERQIIEYHYAHVSRTLILDPKKNKVINKFVR